MHILKIYISSFSANIRVYYHIPPINGSRELCGHLQQKNSIFLNLISASHHESRSDHEAGMDQLFYPEPEKYPNQPKSVHLKSDFTQHKPNPTRPSGRSGLGQKNWPDGQVRFGEKQWIFFTRFKSEPTQQMIMFTEN